jgi:mono/diheme cytochrome c family protein/glucose/arabinose dehydrogenase
MRYFFRRKENQRPDLLSALMYAVGGMFIPLMVVFLCGCQLKKEKDWLNETPDSVAIRGQFAFSPPLSPEESLSKMQVEDGFDIKLVAAEPLVIAPVALNFDNAGRMWVVEMVGYMPDTAGTGEDLPTGNIVILEDPDNDGKADRRKLFLDSLVLPRAISLVENGILIAEPPNLWFVEIKNDQPGRKILVDGEYTQGGNAEHQPNGLIRGLDNWIYSANSRKRYKNKDGRWLIERTHFRGQWGISQDDYGRLFYNNNSANLLGDYFPPGVGATNGHQLEVAGYNETIVKDENVYPARPTPGVNRAYRPGTLDSRLRLRSVTAACSPLVYRGSLFGKEFDQNVFVAEPAGNLVKRNRMEALEYPVTGEQVYSGKEFLASTDERFRPVSLYNGPDGALYIVDMYRGIIEHKTYLTDYLKEEIKRRDLSQPLGYGRIYKVVPRSQQVESVHVPKDADALVAFLGHPNGWARDRAQQMLVEGKYVEAAPELRLLLKSPGQSVSLVHALWTLEGLGLLEPEDLLPLLKHSQWTIRMNALSALPSVMTKKNYGSYLPALKQLLLEKDELSAPLIAFNAHALAPFDRRAADDLLDEVMKQYPENEFVADAVISNLENREDGFLKKVVAYNPDTSLVINKQLRKVLSDISDVSTKRNASALEKKFERGFSLFKSSCQGCHGMDGNGMKALAPPLNRSEWVSGDKEKLASIVLFGLAGPISVNGKLYKAPDITGEMPGIGSNTQVSDEELAELLSFVRASWRNRADAVSAADIARVRDKFRARKSVFTMEELNRDN